MCPRIGGEDFDPAALGPSLISAQNRTAPCLLRLSWDGHPLYYLKGHGWGCVVPIGDNVQRFEELLSRSQDKHKMYDPKIKRFLTIQDILFIVLSIRKTLLWMGLCPTRILTIC